MTDAPKRVQLLPCPFCGGQADVAIFDTTDGGKWGCIMCQQCGAKGPDTRTGYMPATEWGDGAIDEWNRRAPTDAQET